MHLIGGYGQHITGFKHKLPIVDLHDARSTRDEIDLMHLCVVMQFVYTFIRIAHGDWNIRIPGTDKPALRFIRFQLHLYHGGLIPYRTCVSFSNCFRNVWTGQLKRDWER